jgi:hypothetical protein
VSFTEQKLIDRGMGWQVPKWDSVPSGVLTLVITDVSSMRQRWSESPTKPLEGLLNKFMIGLIRAALGVKRQRAEAERRERERQEEERKRQEEARRLEEAERRWREEQARVERLLRLEDVWTRNQRLRELVARLREVLGDVAPDSELGNWLAWAEGYAERSDPLNRFRRSRDEMLTLYYYGYDRDTVAKEGFTEPKLTHWGNEKAKPGIELTERPPRRTAYESALKLELREDVILPYEWPQESEDHWRVFRVPASVVNRALGFHKAAEAQGGPR